VVLHGVDEGGRNQALAEYVGRLFAKGLRELEVLELARGVNATKFRPPLPADEVEAVVRSIAAKHHRNQTDSRGPGEPGLEDGTPVPLHDRPWPGYAHVLADVLPRLTETRDPSHGGVPLPAGWACMAAVLGGITRMQLEEAHTQPGNLDRRETFTACQRRGAYLPPGLHTITGQTGGGKTALVMNLAHTALAGGHPVVYVSLELDAAELSARLVALEGNIPWAPLALRRELTPEMAAKRDAAIASLAPADRQFVALVPDGENATKVAADIRAAVLRLWHETGRQRSPLVVFDYLQAASILTLGQTREASLREHIAAVAMVLRRLSREGLEDYPDWPGCPVVALSITARSNVAGLERVAGFTNNPDEIRYADLETLKAMPKEAGEVEGTAVTAWVMALGEITTETGLRPLTFRLAKNRMGPPGQWVPFTFHARTGRLEEEPGRYRGVWEAEQLAALEKASQRASEKANGKGKRKGGDTDPTPTPGGGYLV
jgi:hypothetical protein